VFGAASPAADAEVIDLTMSFFNLLGVGGLELRLNSLGDQQCREVYRDKLLAFAEPLLAGWSEDVSARMRANPLRLLDSKDPSARSSWRTRRSSPTASKTTAASTSPSCRHFCHPLACRSRLILAWFAGSTTTRERCSR